MAEHEESRTTPGSFQRDEDLLNLIDQEHLRRLVQHRFAVYELEAINRRQEEQLARQREQIGQLRQKLNKARQAIDHLRKGYDLRYQIGDVMVKAARSFKDAVKLPVRLLRLYRQAKRGHFDTVAAPPGGGDFSLVEPISTGKEVLLFMATNGAGLGHLTRLLAIARRMRQLDPEKEIIFYSTSSAMHLILQEGFLGYHFPSKMLFGEEMTARQWNMLLKEQLDTILNLHQPKMLVFDGAYPYAGLVASLGDVGHPMTKVWVKRGLPKPGTENQRQEKEVLFDQVIVPGEAGQWLTFEEKYKTYVPPVIYLDRSELLDRNQVRRQWNIPEGAKLVYVQLGAGNINDIGSTLGMVVDALLKREDVFVILAESIIGKRFHLTRDRVMTLRDYPNSLYFGAFDLAITASGYNTFHELMYFGVPSIFIPNEKTKTDDQVARAKLAVDRGAALMLLEKDVASFDYLLAQALDHETNGKMREAAQSLVQENGADQVARLLLEALPAQKTDGPKA